MSDPFTAAALVGTQRAEAAALLTGTPVDDLIPPDAPYSPERAVLLRAGALSILREAGQVPRHFTTPLIAAAPPDPRPTWSAETSELLLFCLRYQKPLVMECLAVLVASGQICPPEHLPDIFAVRPEITWREELRRVIGARGRWLASQNPAWQWAMAAETAPPPTLAEAQRQWDDGATDERLAALRVARAADPDLGRTWIQATWKHEKADQRIALLHALAADLSPADEPLLERVLEDKSERVRLVAAELLVRLPGSAFLRRMTARGDAVLSVEADGALGVHPPAAKAFDAAWERDGLRRESPRGTSQGNWWVQQVLGHIPPSHWTARFARTPAELCAAFLLSDRMSALIDGLVEGAIRAREITWLGALWQALLAYNIPLRQSLCEALLPMLPPAIAEDAALKLMESPTAETRQNWVTVLRHLPRPWSEELGQRYLTALLHALQPDAPGAALDEYWAASLAEAALGLPRTCLDCVPNELLLATENDWLRNRWTTSADQFLSTIALRQRINQIVTTAAPHPTGGSHAETH